MLGEVREPKPKLEKEKWLREEDFEKEFPNTFEEYKKEVDYLKEFTLEIKEKYPKEIETIDKWTRETGFQGVLVGPEEEEMKLGGFPFRFFLIPENNLANFRQLKDLRPLFAEKGLKLVLEWASEGYKGKNQKTVREQWRIMEEEIKLIKGGKVTDELDAELDETNKSIRLQMHAQFVEKIKEKAVENEEEIIAKLETFLILLDKGIIKIKDKKGDKERLKEYLSKWYPSLEKREEAKDKITDEIIEKMSEIWQKKEAEEMTGYV